MEYAKLLVSVLVFAGALLSVISALRQYRRNEQWKRGEFIAKEIKEFESTPAVRSVFAAIDWTERRINFTGNPDALITEWTSVTRDFLWRSLMPHTVNWASPEFRERSRPGRSSVLRHPQGEGRGKIFSRHAALARDAHDVFLDQLGRFGNFIEAGLISPSEVRPYLGYWLTSLATDQGDEDEARWRCTVLSYLFVYRFQGAVTLFVASGFDIDPDGDLFKRLRRRMHCDALFNALQAEARKTSGAMLDVARLISTPRQPTLLERLDSLIAPQQSSAVHSPHVTTVHHRGADAKPKEDRQAHEPVSEEDAGREEGTRVSKGRL